MLRHIVAVTFFRLLACPPPQLQAGLFFSSLNLKWGAIVLNCLCRDKANFGARTTQRERERGRERRRQRIQRRRRNLNIFSAAAAAAAAAAQSKNSFLLFSDNKSGVGVRAGLRAEGGGRLSLSLSLSLALTNLWLKSWPAFCPLACFTSRCQLDLGSERASGILQFANASGPDLISYRFSYSWRIPLQSSLNRELQLKNDNND